MANAEVSVKDYLNYFVNEISLTNGEDIINTRIAGNYAIEPNDVYAEAVDVSLYHLQLRKCPHRLRMFLANKVAGSLCTAVAESGNHCPFPTVEVLHMAALDSLNKLCHRLIECPELIDSSAFDKVLPYTSSEHAIKNKRHKMEDRHVVIHDLNSFYDLEGVPTSSYYAVFDGHAGVDAASFASAHLHEYLVRHPAFATDPSTAIVEAYKITDTQYCNRSSQLNIKSGGCTAVSALIQGNKLYLAWLGDSQAILVKQGKPVIIMDPHVPDRKDERERIERLGGFVCHLGTWRVNGSLAVSRAIGDQEFKPFISSDPEISVTELDGTEDFLVLACDGLWDCMTPEDASHTLYSTLCNSSKISIDQIAQQMVSLSKQRGSEDNITTIVVFLRNVDDIIRDTLEHSYHTSSNPPEDVPDFERSLIHGNFESDTKSNCIPERPKDLNDISAFPCLKQNSSRLAPEATSLSELPTPPIDEVILGDQFPQIYLSEEGSKSKGSPCSPLDVDPENTSHAIQIASNVVGSVIQTAITQVSISESSNTDVIIDLMSDTSGGENANKASETTNDLSGCDASNKQNDLLSQVYSNEQLAFDSNKQNSAALLKDEVNIETGESNVESVDNILIDYTSQEPNQCPPSLLMQTECIEQNPAFNNMEQSLFGERAVDVQSAVELKMESSVPNIDLVNRVEGQLEAHAVNVLVDTLSCIEKEFVNITINEGTKPSESANEHVIFDPLESNVFSDIGNQNSEEKAPVDQLQQEGPLISAAIVDIDLKSIPVGIPEAEGVVEDNDTDSEKDGGWSYVKASTADPTVVEPNIASDKKQNNVPVKATANSAQKQPVKTSASNTLKSNVTRSDKSKVKQTTTLKQVSKPSSTGVKVLKKDALSLKASEKVAKTVSDKAVVSSKSNTLDKSATAKSALMSRPTTHVKSAAPVKGVASVKPATSKPIIKTTGGILPKINSTGPKIQEKAESASIAKTSSLSKPKGPVATGISKSTLSTSKPAAASSTTSRYTSSTAPRPAASTILKSTSSRSTASRPTVSSVSHSTSTSKSAGMPKTGVAIKRNLQQQTAQSHLNSTPKPATTSAVSKPPVKSIASVTNRATKEDKNNANRLTRAIGSNAVNKNGASNIKDDKSPRKLPKSNLHVKNRTDLPKGVSSAPVLNKTKHLNSTAKKKSPVTDKGKVLESKEEPKETADVVTVEKAEPAVENNKQQENMNIAGEELNVQMDTGVTIESAACEIP